MKYIKLCIVSLFPRSRFLPKDKIKVGYNKLVENRMIQNLNDLTFVLIKNDHDSKNDLKFQKNILDIPMDKILQIHNQWKSTRLLQTPNFLAALSLSVAYGKQFIYPLTKEWIVEISKSGIKINKVISPILFKFLLLSKCLVSFKKTLVFLCNSIHKNHINFDNSSPLTRAVYIPNLQLGHLSGDFEYNFIGWLKRKESATSNLAVFHSNSKISDKDWYQDNVTLQFIDLRLRWNSGVLKDFIFRLTLVLKCFLNFIRLNNKGIVLSHFYEIVTAKYVCAALPVNTFSYSLFDQSQGSLLPLWASVLNDRGTRSIIFFYATAADLELELGKKFKPSLWANISWEEIWVIDKTQRLSLQSVVLNTKTKFREIGVPDWIDTNVIIPKISPAIVLFDSEPQQNLYYLSSNISLGMFTEEFYERFFHDILEKAKYYNFSIIHKSKKDTSKHCEPFYNEIRSNLGSKYSNYHIIDSAIAPKKLLESSVASICQPPSTTALIARSLNLPTIYYDPLNKINPKDQILRGIPLVYPTDLKTWFDNLRKGLN